MDFKDSSIEG